MEQLEAEAFSSVFADPGERFLACFAQPGDSAARVPETSPEALEATLGRKVEFAPRGHLLHGRLSKEAAKMAYALLVSEPPPLAICALAKGRQKERLTKGEKEKQTLYPGYFIKTMGANETRLAYFSL